jgi:prepilin-type N-terminal cleavage/methylation domain-containing protein
MAMDFINQRFSRHPICAYRIQQRGRKSFTLIELLVVVAIIAVLIAILLPALSMARETTKKVMCASQLKQWHVAHLMYASDFSEWLVGGDWWSGLYIRQSIAKYLGGAITINTFGKQCNGDRDFWRNWVTCPSRRGTANEYVHFWSPDRTSGPIVRGEYMVEGEYQYFGGHGNFGVKNTHGGDYPDIGWVSGYFSNGHHPNPKVNHSFGTGNDADSVLMVDANLYTWLGGVKVPYPDTTFAWQYAPNHGWFKGRAGGQNMLGLDGHVNWVADPWMTGQLRWYGGRGMLDW